MLKILLPPSEAKAGGGGDPGWDPASGRFAELGAPRLRIAHALKRARGGNERILGVRGERLVEARAANRALVGAPTMPACARFTGVVWQHFGPVDLGARGLARAREAVLVVSALTGLSAWDDPVPNFRLKLSASVAPVGRCATFWREPLSRVLNDHLAGHTVVDLLPHEHRAAWIPDPSRYAVVRPVLVKRDGTPAGHAGKAAKGRLARALVQSGDVERTLATFAVAELLLTVVD